MKFSKITLFLGLFILILSASINSNSLVFAEEPSLATNYLIQFGKTYFDKQSYAEAKEEFQKCLLIDPKNKTAIQYLSKIEEKLKQETNLTNKQANSFAKKTSRTISGKQSAIENALNFAENKNQPPKKQNSYHDKKLEEKPKTGVEDRKKAAEDKFETWVGGAWALPQNLLYLETFTQYYWHNQQFNNDRKKVYWAGGGKDIERNIEAKINYGITNNLTYMVHIPYKSLLWKDLWQRNRTKGVCDIWTGFKYQLTPDIFAVTPQFRVKIPTNYNPNKTPSLGRDQWDYEFMILTATKFDPWHIYAKLDTGYRVRSGARSTDEIPYFFEAGYIPFNWLLLKTTIDGVNGIGGTGNIEEDYTKFTAGALFNFFRQFKVEAGYGRTFAGKNTSAADEWYFKTVTLF